MATTKYTINDLKHHAESKGGKCLSDEYKNIDTKYLWKCEFGHQWERTWYELKKSNWCPECQSKKISKSLAGYLIDDLKKFAENKNGQCLSEEYINTNIKYLWKCECGNKWNASWCNVNNLGQWCPKCANKKSGSTQRLNISLAHELAIKKNGKCLSIKYINVKTKLLWECEKQHQWEADLNHILRGQWCPTCNANIVHTLEEAKNIALKQNGLCLSNEYKGIHEKMLWQCDKGHQWESSFISVFSQKTWCQKCGHIKKGISKSKKFKDSFENDSREIFGDIFDYSRVNYKNTTTKVEIGCKKCNNWFFVKPNSHLKRNQGCPNCRIYFHQEVCRQIFNNIFNENFISIYPEFLKNPVTNRKLQLDGYCEKLNIAFEYNGKQHYEKCFNMNDMDFDTLKKRDKIKIKICKKLNIKIIIIPYWINVYKIEEFIKNELSKQLIDFDKNIFIDINEIIKTIRLKNINVTST